jgi:threonine/homoserine/homoserine lactone efflux protein
LPQFLEADRSLFLQFTILIATTILVDAVVLTSYALIALRGAGLLKRSSFGLWCQRAYGAALLGFAGRLLFGERLGPAK